jgi:hypothetical protein
MRACVKLLTGPYGKLLSTLLGGIQIDGQLAEAFRSRWLEPRRREAKEVLQRGIDRGELPPGIDQEALIDALYGPLYFRLLFSHQRLTTKLSDRVVEMVFGRSVLQAGRRPVHSSNASSDLGDGRLSS